ncbi:hypothetical protein [Spiroplasma sp. BIUS-1]|uniref:hypothetical protein n=1 Tax=Spiroplasma sp. BIUS-1 TaxID=216964 RepID=UPI00139752B3|nr:hypothetical protein [Spiroplasma sp. BIUS-1]QHX36418.1 hypothetical protein SBIUS_v1c01650 [Spiroplasma sp. BIUS-1]
MRRVRVWRFIIMSIISICLIFVIPWLTVTNDVNGYKIGFSASAFTTTAMLILISGIAYLGAGFLANGLKNKPGKVFGVVNAVMGFGIIVLLSIHTFIGGVNIAFKMTYFMPLFSLLTVDLVLAIIHISIKPGAQQNQNVQQAQAVQGHQFATNEDSNSNVNISTPQTQDVTELKNKILNMKSGLSKSYEEAIDEIERTGALSGLDMSELLKEDEQADKNKIIPYSVEDQMHYQQPQQPVQVQQPQQYQQPQQPQQPVQQEPYEPKHYTPRREYGSNVQDPLANSSSDYESIHSSSLSRKDYKYTSRRNDIDENKH